jgi:hypothetical protein
MATPRRSKDRIASADEGPPPRAEAVSQTEPAADGEAESARHRRIAERAYRRAEHRGFAPGRELDDWLAAEVEEDGNAEAHR